MGSGKTAVGRLLAKELGMKFYDSDAEIETSTGVDIPYIFEKEGEQSFRERERECIARLTREKNIVLATGGGTVLNEHNRQNLADTGTVIYLRASVDQQLERTQQTRNRPILLEGNPKAILTRLASQRGPLYEELASVSVDTGECHVRSVVSRVVRILKARNFKALKN